MYSYDPETDPIRNRSIRQEPMSSRLSPEELEELGMRPGRQDKSEADIRESQENLKIQSDQKTASAAEDRAYQQRQDAISRSRARRADAFLEENKPESKAVRPEGGEIEEIYSTENARDKFIENVRSILKSRDPNTEVRSAPSVPTSDLPPAPPFRSYGVDDYGPVGKDAVRRSDDGLPITETTTEPMRTDRTTELPFNRDTEGPFFASSEDLTRDLKPPPVDKDAPPLSYRGNPKSDRKRFRPEKPELPPEIVEQLDEGVDPKDLSDTTVLAPELYRPQPGTSRKSGLDYPEGTPKFPTLEDKIRVHYLNELLKQRGMKPKRAHRMARDYASDAIKNWDKGEK